MKVAVSLLVLAAVVAALALFAATELDREYGYFWGPLAWGVAFALVPLVAGILLIRRSRKNRP